MRRESHDGLGRAASVEAVLPDWVSALESRHLADLRVPEVTRALRALSSAYVERRHSAAEAEGRRVRGALDSAGKRAAFALFYAPLHFIAVARVIAGVGGSISPVRRVGPLQAERLASTGLSGREATRHGEGGSILDLGCGTGAAGAAWALASGVTPSVTGIDQHRWAVDEARWTYAHFGLRGRARVGDISRLPAGRAGDGIVAAYVLNELGDTARRRVEDQLLTASDRGARVLVVEPISRAITPWWTETAARIVDRGGRADEWRVSIDLPPLLKTLDHAAGLDHRELAFRTLFI